MPDACRTNFLELEPHAAASGIGVMVLPGAGWGASALREPAALLTAAGHAVLLCDPSGSAANPGPFRYDELARDCAARAAGWKVQRVVVLAHSMGARTAAHLARVDPRIEQVWVAPLTDSRGSFAALYAAGAAGQFHRVVFEPPLSAPERAALDVLSTGAWLDPARFDALEAVLALESRGGVRVPNIWAFLREVAHPGYVLVPQDALRLKRVLVPPDDAWVPLGLSQAFCGAARVPLHILSRGLGHAVSGGWSEVLETLHAWLVPEGASEKGETHGVS